MQLLMLNNMACLANHQLNKNTHTSADLTSVEHNDELLAWETKNTIIILINTKSCKIKHQHPLIKFNDKNFIA